MNITNIIEYWQIYLERVLSLLWISVFFFEKLNENTSRLCRGHCKSLHSCAQHSFRMDKKNSDWEKQLLQAGVRMYMFLWLTYFYWSVLTSYTFIPNLTLPLKNRSSLTHSPKFGQTFSNVSDAACQVQGGWTADRHLRLEGLTAKKRMPKNGTTFHRAEDLFLVKWYPPTGQFT